MNQIDNVFYPNEDCKDYGLQNQRSISFRGKYVNDSKPDTRSTRIMPQFV